MYRRRHVALMQRRRRLGYSETLPNGRVLTQKQIAFGDVVMVAITDNLQSAGLGWVDWYIDGVHLVRTSDRKLALPLDKGSQAQVTARVQRFAEEPAPDVVELGQQTGKALTIEWIRATAADTQGYIVQQATGQSTPASNAWTTIFELPHDQRWRYRVTTPPLVSGTYYWHRVRTIDVAGNIGADLTLGPSLSGAAPDAPTVAMSFSNSTQRVTVAAAS